MSTAESTACIVCGSKQGLTQCNNCAVRLNNTGFSVAVCAVCVADDVMLVAAGKMLKDDIQGSAIFRCNPCWHAEKRQKQEALLKAVGGSTPTDILRSVAATAPWFLVLKQASSDELLTALMKVKRRMDFTSTAQELADSLAANDAMAAVLVHTAAISSAESLTRKAMDAFVSSKCPSIKYKDLLLPSRGGSLDKAKRHFSELARAKDPIVAALASERDFLCDYIEKQVTPAPKRHQRNSVSALDPPEHVLVWLRYLFKSLSQRIKKAAARDEGATLLVKAWYSDHLTLSQSMMHAHYANQRSNMSSSSGLVRAPQVASAPRPVNPRERAPPPTESASKRQRQNNTPKGKGMGKALPRYQPLPAAEDDGWTPQLRKLFVKPANADQANQILFEAVMIDRQGVWKIFRKHCRNCWAAGRGWIEHKLGECRKAGNVCIIDCFKCGPNKRHWLEDCPGP